MYEQILVSKKDCVISIYLYANVFVYGEYDLDLELLEPVE